MGSVKRAPLRGHGGRGGNRLRHVHKVLFVVLGTFAILALQQFHDYVDSMSTESVEDAESAASFGAVHPRSVGRTLSSEFSLIQNILGDCGTLADQLLAVPYLIICIWFFLGLAIVCDEYFVASLEMISDALRLSEDVAGATFMAAGSSAPELFTSIIGVFLTKNDVGVGTIVGSAIFNICIIIGITALLAGQTLQLDWRPLTRDSLCYGASILLMAVSFLDEKVEWFEAMLFVLFYAFYIFIMFINKWLMQGMAWLQFKLFKTLPPESPDDEIEEAVETFVEGEVESGDGTTAAPGTIEMQEVARTRAESAGLMKNKLGAGASPSLGSGRVSSAYASPYLTSDGHGPGRMSFDRTNSSGRPSIDARRVGYSALNPRMKWKVAVAAIIAGHRWIDAMNDDQKGVEGGEKVDKVTRELAEEARNLSSGRVEGIDGLDPTLEVDIPEDEEKPPHQVIVVLKKIMDVTLKILSAPYLVLFLLTVPDCRRPGCWSKLYVITFTMSIVWIGVLSFFMVDFAGRAGCALGIPDTIMGLTFLAAGTSVPDALGSVIVAKDGKGDMAIANALGSNVFDICFGLGFPWFVKTAFVELGQTPIDVGADGLFALIMFVIILFLILVVVFVTLAARKFKLAPVTGWLFIGMYVAFVIYCIIFTFAIKPNVTLPFE